MVSVEREIKQTECIAYNSIFKKKKTIRNMLIKIYAQVHDLYNDNPICPVIIARLRGHWRDTSDLFFTIFNAKKMRRKCKFKKWHILQ